MKLTYCGHSTIQIEKAGRRVLIDPFIYDGLGLCHTDVGSPLVFLSGRDLWGKPQRVWSAKMLRPGITVPVHYNTFPEIEVDVTQWESRMLGAGLQSQALRPGETLSI
ncbi:MAG: L-ascorbate metabolism protein UlaG (beta-lactamase superfamily) [Rhodothermales bacterium]|jgi:L-ascorbate metabolism protein UlaG (beta-lactamase superfamily)